MQLFEMLVRLRGLSPTFSRVLLIRLVPRIILLSDGMGVTVQEWSAERCVLELPFRRKNRNHLGSMYFGAQMTLADLAVGLLLFQHFPMDRYGGVIKRVEADFRAKGKGALRCVAELPDDVADVLNDARVNDSGKAEAWVPMQLTGPDGKTVTEVRTLVAIKRFGPPEKQA